MDRLGRKIYKNPGTGGKYYVMNGTKKIYSINKNFNASNEPGYYTVLQLQQFAKSAGLTGYSKLKKDALFTLLKNRTVSRVTDSEIRKYVMNRIGQNVSRGDIARALNVDINRVRKIHSELREQYMSYVYLPDKNRYKTFAEIINRNHD
jgi:hypothetical protein